MNELFLGFPIWNWIILSIILSIIEAPFIFDGKTLEGKAYHVSYIFVNIFFMCIPALLVSFIFIMILIWNTPIFIASYFKKETNEEQPIEIFACFNSDSNIKHYSIKQGENEIAIKTTSLEFVQNIKECLERDEIAWDYVYNCSDKISGRNLIELELKIEDIKQNRITNKIKIKEK